MVKIALAMGSALMVSEGASNTPYDHLLGRVKGPRKQSFRCSLQLDSQCQVRWASSLLTRTATPHLLRYACDCEAGWQGTDCATPTACNAGPNGNECQSGGAPAGVTGSCKCKCRPGYGGALCERCVAAHRRAIAQVPWFLRQFGAQPPWPVVLNSFAPARTFRVTDICAASNDPGGSSFDPNAKCSGHGTCRPNRREQSPFKCVCVDGYTGEFCDAQTTTTTTSSTSSTSSSTSSSTTLLVCGPGERLDLLRRACLPCDRGTYRPSSDGKHIEQECIEDSGCSDGEVTVTPGDTMTPTVCAAAQDCSTEQFESKPAVGGRDRQCASLRKCARYEYELTAPTATSDRQCTVVSNCQRGQYEHRAPTETSDRECYDCDPNNFEWSDRRNPKFCREFSFCGRNERVRTQGTQTRDLKCARCPRGQYRNDLEHRYDECLTPAPTPVPTAVPTQPPTAVPTDEPTAAPTKSPSPAPTDAPTIMPTAEPTRAPAEPLTAKDKDAGTTAATDPNGNAHGSSTSDEKGGSFGTTAIVLVAVIVVAIIAAVAVVVVVVMKRKTANDATTGRPGEESFSNPMYDSMASAATPAGLSQPTSGTSSGYMDVSPTPASSGYMDVVASQPAGDEEEDV